MSQFATNIEEVADTTLVFKISQASNTISRETQWLIYRIILLITDGLMIGIAFRLAYWVRFELSFGIFNDGALISVQYYQIFNTYFNPTLVPTL